MKDSEKDETCDEEDAVTVATDFASRLARNSCSSQEGLTRAPSGAPRSNKDRVRTMDIKKAVSSSKWMMRRLPAGGEARQRAILSDLRYWH